MRVAPKLVLAAWLAFLPMLGLHTWLSARRQETLLRYETERSLALLGEHLRQVAVAEWARVGSAEVDVLLAAASSADRDVRIEWLPPAPRRVERGPIDAEPDRMTWLEPVLVDGASVGRIAISESLEPMHRHLRLVWLRIGLLSVGLGVAGIVLARALGERWIGRRLAVLVEFARRTGAGRLGDRVDVGGNDEIAALAASLSDMSGQLADARQQSIVADAERLAMLQQLRHADRLAGIGRLASSVAHELGTPLNVAMGHARRIQKEPSRTEEVLHSAEVVHRQMERMAETIRSILGFVRRVPTRAGAVDLIESVANVRTLLAPLLDERRIDLAVRSEVESAPVEGNPIQLEQAISNLVTNAVDATPDAGRVEVTIARREGAKRLVKVARKEFEIRVRDHGPGVPESLRERIFEPFFTSKPEGTGTGLGLWITHGIVQDHGGSIRCESPPDGGACFVVRLPEIGAS